MSTKTYYLDNFQLDDIEVDANHIVLTLVEKPNGFKSWSVELFDFDVETYSALHDLMLKRGSLFEGRTNENSVLSGKVFVSRLSDSIATLEGMRELTIN